MNQPAGRRALGEVRSTPASAAAFEPLPAPQPQEWLSLHEEHGQSFDKYVRTVTRPTAAGRSSVRRTRRCDRAFAPATVDGPRQVRSLSARLMIRHRIVLTIPNTHTRDVGVGFLAIILRQAGVAQPVRTDA